MPIAADLVYREGGLVRALVAAEITLYFTRFPQPADALARAYHLALGCIGPHIRWYQTERMSSARPVTSAALSALPGWFREGATPRSEYRLLLTSGELIDDVAPWGLEFGVRPGAMDLEAGYFQVSLPVDFLESAPAEFTALVRSLASLLDFRSGHAGYGIQYDDGYVFPDRDAQMHYWCNRYRGLDFRELIVTAPHVIDTIKGVSWLTLLDPGLCKRLGGLERLQKNLPTSALLEEVPHGVLIQAGSAPSLGDRHRGEDMSAYRAVNSVLRPVRVENTDWALRCFDADGTSDWLGRFDTQ